MLIYDELTYFASKLYSGTTITASDAVQDAFLFLWQRRDLRFTSVQYIKSYLYVIIKNRFLNNISHRRHIDKYMSHLALNEDRILTYMVESEVYSSVSNVLKMLPEDCARIFEFHIDGWNAKEIARKLDISERTVYNKLARATGMLKNKLSKDTLMILLLFVADAALDMFK